jgi:eukaryotic-like serine/threonine-protein kinase
MAILPGTRLGPYEVLSAIGAGGMGEVYRARDTKLEREIAIKVLPANFVNDPERLARFQREARMLAALNHPGIATIYGLEQADGVTCLVMELVPGENLAERLKAGPLGVEEALKIAVQIAEALEAAHEKNIIHRDLKPANVKVTPEGKVKVLDFGLAKAFEGDAAEVDMSNSPTLSRAATMQGVILGTAAYMSPEQARGRTVDKRTDIWAFGAVLYELLTGKQAFHGEDVTDILAAVVRAEPDWTKLPASAPQTIRVLLKRCLQKDKALRLRDAGDARIEILESFTASPAAEPIPQKRRSLEYFAWMVAAVFFLVALGLAFVHFRGPGEETRALKLFVPPPEKAEFGTGYPPAVSPDGRRLAFVLLVGGGGQRALWVRDLDSLEPRPLNGTEGASDPFWSPDSRFLAFFAGGKLKKIDVAGGPALTLADAASDRGGSWGRNDIIVFSPTNNGGLFRVPASGGDATPITELDTGMGEINHRYPWFLPDGRHYLYTAYSSNDSNTAIYSGELDSKKRQRVLNAISNVVYTPPGYLLFLRERTLMAQPFDAGKVQTSGDPVPIAEHVDSFPGIATLGQFSASQNGVLAYTSGSAGATVQLTWLDRSGKVLGTVGPPSVMYWPAISPDGSTVAFDRADPSTGAYDIWLHDLARGTDSRFTFNSKNNMFPVWAPDGSHVAFYSNREGLGDTYQKAANGAAQDEALDKSPMTKRPDDWSHDGRYIIEEINGRSKTGSDIWVLPLFGDRKPFPYLQTEFNERQAKLSPNGQWLAYVSDETKRNEVYVQTFPTPGGKWQVSTNGGTRPVWSRDGRELFFIGGDQKMMAIEVKSDVLNGGGKFDAGLPKPLFDTHFALILNGWFDVTKDGRFLIPTLVEQTASVPMTVVVNWQAGLKK